MKILYLCFDPGIPVLGDKGASVHVREMIAALHRTGHDMTLVCASRGSGNSLPPGTLIEISPVDYNVHVTGDPARGERGRIAYDRDLPDLVVTALEAAGILPAAIYERFALFSSAGVGIAEYYGIPRLLEVNAPLVEEQARYRDLRMRRDAETLERISFWGADRVIAVSDAVGAYAVERSAKPARVEVLRNGVDLERFHPDIPTAELRSRHGLTGRPVIGFVGSLKPWHGMVEFIDAFTHIRERVARAALLIVGDGPGSVALREIIAQRGLTADVVTTGRVSHDEVPSYLCAMDLTVAPYRSADGFYFSPLKVVESLACGTPVVAPALGQLTTLVQDGVTGRLYVPDDSSALAAAAVEILADDKRRRAMSRAAAAFAQNTCSWSANACRIDTILGTWRRGSLARHGVAPLR
jgi:glycosyltransferase involved in cell wall biosynthesis